MTTDRSTPDLFADTLAQFKTMIRLEIRLVQAEMSEKFALLGRSGGYIAIAGLLLMAAFITLLSAIADALVLVGLPHFAAEFIVALVVIAGAATLMLMAKRNLTPANLKLTKSMDQFTKSVSFIKAGGK